MTPTRPQRLAITGAALLALFLGALDALVISAAMPTVIAELGGLPLYSWVYSAYFLARAVSLPIIGKLADLFKTRTLFLISIGTFLVASIAAGISWDMTSLIVSRVVQGVGAGGIFALVYIVLADVAPPDQRGRFLSVGSAVWGIASVLGPTLGGLIVTYLSWRWIFFINAPLALASIWGIGAYLIEVRPKKENISLDVWGAITLTTTIISFLFAFLMAGRTYRWLSPHIITLLGLFSVSAIAFLWIEHRARDPILSIGFFKNRGFATGNAAVFLSSFAIFSMFAFAPLFIQGAQGRTPMQVGIAMVSLSLGWSIGSLGLGRVVDRWGYKPSAVTGTLLLVGGCAMTLLFELGSTLAFIFSSFFVIGMGMGFVGLSTLLLVQASLDTEHLGVATSSNQLARTLGGTMGVGICGSFIAIRFASLEKMVRASGIAGHFPKPLSESGSGHIEGLLSPEIQATMPPGLLQMVQTTMVEGVRDVFWAVTVVAVMCLAVCLLMPASKRASASKVHSLPAVK